MSTEYIWFKKGKESRRTVDPEGKKPTMEKLPNGFQIKYSYDEQDGNLAWSIYSKDGVYQSYGDKPASTEYYADGTIEAEYWAKNGEHHRDDDKPAIIGYHEDGTIDYEYYYTDGSEYNFVKH